MRRNPRHRIEVDIVVHSPTCGRLRGHSVDLSESGLAAMLTMEAPVGELVELEFELPGGKVRVYATVRQRTAFRYGFQFLDPGSNASIHETCRQLAIAESISGSR